MGCKKGTRHQRKVVLEQQKRWCDICNKDALEL